MLYVTFVAKQFSGFSGLGKHPNQKSSGLFASLIVRDGIQ
jgi:hypothetical protein